MSNFNLLSGKFAAAKLPEVCIPRRALLNAFHREAEKRVIFVSAPAGYGKTVSTLQWLADSGREPIWIRLDGYDNTPLIFYKLCCTGILSTQPENKLMADILKDPAFTLSPVECTIRLLSEFQPDGKQYAIVLDGMHLLGNEEIRRSGLFVEKRLPSSFVTLILTRNEIEEKYITYVDRENCAVITARDLAFSAEEIRKYFEAFGHSITIEEAEAVHAVTDGWAIGVNALAMGGQIKLGLGSVEILGNYINTHIWDNLDEELQDFMLQTAIDDTISAELANRLTGRGDSREILQKLRAQNAFISQADGDMYRYHPLFSGFLQNMRKRRGEAFINTMHKRAADYYCEKGEYFSARRYALRSGDSTAILNSYILMNTGESVSIDEYVKFYAAFLKDPISESICNQNPYIYATFVWYYFLIGDAPKTEYYLNLLNEYLPVIFKNYSQFTEILILVCAIDYRIGLPGQIERFKAFGNNIQASRNQLKGISLSMQLPYAHRTIRDFRELADEKLMDEFAASLGTFLEPQSDIMMLTLRSGILIEQNLIKEALEITLRAKSMINGATKDEAAFCIFIHLASIYSAMGDEYLFTDAVGQLEQYLEKSGLCYFNQTLTAFKTMALLMDGDKSAARIWLDNSFVNGTRDFVLYKIFIYFTTARAHMLLSQTDKAINYIGRLKKLGTDFHRPLDIAEANVLHAVLQWAMGRRSEALAIMEETLISMQEYGFVRVFANEGAAVLPMLRKLAVNLEKNHHQTRLDTKFLIEVMIASYDQSKRHKGIAMNIHAPKPVKLSKQQKYIITLLSKGYRNAEIVEITGLTIHTVKSHCSAAYAKLEVNNAMDAVLKAKELELID